jgi:hypothetical protein
MCDIIHFFRTYCLLLKLDKYNKDFTNMCLAIPGRILSLDDSIPELKMAKVDFSGIVKNICVQWVDVSIGDYVGSCRYGHFRCQCGRGGRNAERFKAIDN